MFIQRHSKHRGRSQTNWLDSYHTFSFADYDDDAWKQFNHLRVINEDFIKPGSGFGMHTHRDMEIITYVISGALEHKDSLGNGSIIQPGEIQRMSAGSGIQHSEFNHSQQEALHLLQIWIFPEENDLHPSYEQKRIHPARNTLILLASKAPTKEGVMIHQNTHLYAGYFDRQIQLAYKLKHHAWLQMIHGHIQLNGYPIHAGDGIGIFDEKELLIHSIEASDFLLFEMF